MKRCLTLDVSLSLPPLNPLQKASRTTRADESQTKIPSLNPIQPVWHFLYSFSPCPSFSVPSFFLFPKANHQNCRTRKRNRTRTNKARRVNKSKSKRPKKKRQSDSSGAGRSSTPGRNGTDLVSYHSRRQTRGWTECRFEEQTTVMPAPAFEVQTRLALGKKSPLDTTRGSQCSHLEEEHRSRVTRGSPPSPRGGRGRRIGNGGGQAEGQGRA